MALDSFYQPTSDLIRHKVSLVAIYYLIVAGGAIFFGVTLFYGSAQLSERISMRLRSMLFEALMRREIRYVPCHVPWYRRPSCRMLVCSYAVCGLRQSV